MQAVAVQANGTVISFCCCSSAVKQSAHMNQRNDEKEMTRTATARWHSLRPNAQY